MVRVGRLELPASCSQSKRATNCATPGYEVFQLWSNMGSAPVFDQFPARGKTPSALASQSFPGFWRSAARTPASRSQSRRATNCATPGYEVVGWPGRILPKQARYRTALHPVGRGRAASCRFENCAVSRAEPPGVPCGGRPAGRFCYYNRFVPPRQCGGTKFFIFPARPVFPRPLR